MRRLIATLALGWVLLVLAGAMLTGCDRPTDTELESSSGFLDDPAPSALLCSEPDTELEAPECCPIERGVECRPVLCVGGKAWCAEGEALEGDPRWCAFVVSSGVAP